MRPIIFLDANSVWHFRLAEALANQVPLSAINPRAGFVPSVSTGTRGALTVVDVTLPRGWASATALIGQSMLRQVILRVARQLEGDPVLVLSSPAYASLARGLQGRLPLISYTADDYRSYAGWGGSRIVRKEQRLHDVADLSVFVSEALRDRAADEFGLSLDRTLVCPNATEPRFAARDTPRPPEFAARPTPIVGILGGLSDRLDLDLISRVLSNPSVKTLLVAGSIAHATHEGYPGLRSEKVVATGHLPHAEMHRYALAMDAALIPYARTQLNYHCSPMRLFDHLATGMRIFAAAGCHQIDTGHYRNVEVAPADQIVEKLEVALKAGLPPRSAAPNDILWEDRATRFIDAMDCVLA